MGCVCMVLSPGLPPFRVESLLMQTAGPLCEPFFDPLLNSVSRCWLTASLRASDFAEEKAKGERERPRGGASGPSANDSAFPPVRLWVRAGGLLKSHARVVGI